MSSSTAVTRIEVAETRVVMPPDVQRLQVPDAGFSRFVSRYTAYRRRLRFLSDDPGNRCDTYYLSPWMVMAVVDVASIERFESPLSGQDIVEFHYRVSGGIETRRLLGRVPVVEPSCLIWFQPSGCDDASERLGAARVWPGDVGEPLLRPNVARGNESCYGGHGLMLALSVTARGASCPRLPHRSADWCDCRRARDIIAREA